MDECDGNEAEIYGCYIRDLIVEHSDDMNSLSNLGGLKSIVVKDPKADKILYEREYEEGYWD